jgi:hypothetical protein
LTWKCGTSVRDHRIHPRLEDCRPWSEVDGDPFIRRHGLPAHHKHLLHLLVGRKVVVADDSNAGFSDFVKGVEGRDVSVVMHEVRVRHAVFRACQRKADACKRLRCSCVDAGTGCGEQSYTSMNFKARLSAQSLIEFWKVDMDFKNASMPFSWSVSSEPLLCFDQRSQQAPVASRSW